MTRITLRISVAVFLLFTVHAATAQDVTKQVTLPETAPVITGTALAERLRFTAPNTVVQMQLQIYADSGQLLFDVTSKGNVLDWTLQDGGGEHLVPGSYLCVVTVKSLSGKISQRIGSALVQEKQVELQRVDETRLSAAQLQAIGPLEENGALTILKAVEVEASTVLANDGKEGQLIRDRGALSFRIGDFFSGADKEQMRLTEEGNLGVGTANPKARLDVAGMIRAREGFQFSDGSTLKVNDKGVLTHTSADGTGPSALSSTQNRIAKFTDNAGTVGDSVAIDTGTGLQLTAAPSGAVDTNLLYLNSTNGTTGVLAGNVPSYGAANGPFFAMRGNTFTTIANQRGLFTIAAGNVSSPVGDDGSVKFNTGNDLLRMIIKPSGKVGIGVSNPLTLLDVGGDINTSTQYNIGAFRLLSTPGIGNTFVGVLAGLSNNSGNHNTFVGDRSGSGNVGGDTNSFFGAFAGNSGDGNGNSLFGYGAGSQNVSGNNITVIGANAGVGAGSLDHATAIGANAFVSSSNTIALGRADGSDTVDVPGKLQIDTMGTSGGTQLCLNSSSRVAFCSSSLRYKMSVSPFRSGLEIIRRLHPITFTWREGGQRDIGLGAEEVERVEPLLTFRNQQGEIEGVKYNQLSAVLVNAFKEQQAQIQQQQEQMGRQQGQLVRQQEQLEKLTRLVYRRHGRARIRK